MLTLFFENRISTVASFKVLRRISNEVADRFSPGCGDLVTWRKRVYYYQQQYQYNSSFWATTFLTRLCQIVYFAMHYTTPLDFGNSNSLTEQGDQPCIHPLTWGTRYLHVCSPVMRCPSCPLQHWVPISSPSTTRWSTVYSNLPPHGEKR
jgi:hypothetical protein